ncbi:UxaA family hydrolase [Limnochorda pilosa]|uniref:D-galactarate dehydratase n=1 Tax=Limnochorda pilosa TaxID=1555112 RepID=A0A0K2SL48_LIMPI|nr:UxaA family hydrolase [Limnochorda pilosa]BAS27825.1 D-galactarate dehydratase [Limnochorda pilosa]
MAEAFLGYRRENGAVGVRNYVAIIPVDDISNAAAEGVSRIIQGTLALPHPYGRLQFGADLELFFRTLIGTGANPNVAAAVVIGIEPNWTERVADGIARTGKPVAAFHIERSGDLKIVEQAARAAKEFVHQASELRREEAPVAELVMSIKCGESDTTSGLASNPTVGKAVERVVAAGGTVLFGETSELTGGEPIVAERIKDPAEREKFQRIFDEYQRAILDQDADLLGSQPTQGNIAGGLTTIEEKALGNIQKIGKAQVDGVLEMAEEPRGRGLYFMNTSSAAAEAITLFAAGGAVLHLFPTGQGNIVGNPIVPVIKLSANPVTVRTMSEHIDLDVSGILTLEESLEQAGDRLMDLVLRTASGRRTAAEVLGHREFVLTKLYRSA